MEEVEADVRNRGLSRGVRIADVQVGHVFPGG